MSSAKLSDMQTLHNLLCQKFAAILDSDEDCTAAELTTIRQFLKDNNIEADPGDRRAPIRGIAERLADHGDDSDTVPETLQ